MSWGTFPCESVLKSLCARTLFQNGLGAFSKAAQEDMVHMDCQMKPKLPPLATMYPPDQ